MKRCCRAVEPLSPKLLISVALAALVGASNAQTDSSSRDADRRSGVVLSAADDANLVIDGAVGRRFPANVKRGVMRVLTSPEISMDGKPDRLSVGSRIRNLDNMVVSPSHLVGQGYVVNYRRGIGGEISDVWMLTVDEAKVKLPTDPANREKNSWFSSSEKPAVDNGDTAYDKLPKWNPATPR